MTNLSGHLSDTMVSSLLYFREFLFTLLEFQQVLGYFRSSYNNLKPKDKQPRLLLRFISTYIFPNVTSNSNSPTNQKSTKSLTYISIIFSNQSLHQFMTKIH